MDRLLHARTPTTGGQWLVTLTRARHPRAGRTRADPRDALLLTARKRCPTDSRASRGNYASGCMATLPFCSPVP